jgi:TetR/AcrR family transcriptional regulator, cholesterol catabolism regulator
MTYAEFSKLIQVSKKDICRETFAENRKTIRIKKEKTVVKNLEKIFGAVLKISNQKGFQAMTMRDLSQESGLSMGALYAYFSGKDELVEMLQHQRRSISGRIINETVNAQKTPWGKLKAAIYTHLYLSEAMQPWFYFSFMEAKNLNKEERKKAVLSEQNSEKMFTEIIKEGQAEGVFSDCHGELAAGQIKALLQDWYLKHSKYTKRNVTVEQYAKLTLEFVEAFLMNGAKASSTSLTPS